MEPGVIRYNAERPFASLAQLAEQLTLNQCGLSEFAGILTAFDNSAAPGAAVSAFINGNLSVDRALLVTILAWPALSESVRADILSRVHAARENAKES
jgi:hypothetical protein